MKKITLVLVLAIFAFNSNLFSQSQGTKIVSDKDLKTQFSKDANAFFKFFNEEKWSGMTEMMYPKLFKFATKEQMIAGLNQMSENGMKMTVNSVNIYKVSNPIIEKNETFRKLSYRAKMKILISGEMLESADLLKESFKESFGEKNVTYDKTINTFSINSDKALIAILGKDDSKWKYLEFNESQPELLQNLFPEGVYQKFKTK